MLLHTQNHSRFAFSQTYDQFESIESDNKLGIIGAPFDGTSAYKTGSRFGPGAVREASYNFERYNLVLDKKLDVPLFDFGDIEIVQGNFKSTCSIIQSTVSELLDDDIVPVTIGGEHIVTYGVLKSFDIQNTTFIHFDAHMDLRDDYMGEKYSHATAIRRVYDLNPYKMIQIGIRSCSEKEKAFADENEITYFTAHEVYKDINNIKESIKNIEGPLYVSLDIDVLDPAYAPSVSTPSPCGLTPFQLESFINCLKGKEVIGFDLVEVCSTEFGDITSINGSKAIYDFLCTQ